MRKAALLLLLCFVNFYFLGATVSAKPLASPKAKTKKATVKKSLKRKRIAPTRVARKSRAVSHTKAHAIKRTASLRGKRLVAFTPQRSRMAAPALRHGTGELGRLANAGDLPGLSARAALVLDQLSSQVLFEKNADDVLPIASITKLMTAFVVLEAQQDLQEIVTVTTDDIDRIKHTSSRLPIGARLTRAEMLHIALMSSENRAASALGRHYPGGLPAFVEAMNAQAKLLGMIDTHYVEPTGLSSANVSTAQDLARLVAAAERHPLIKKFSTHPRHAVAPGGRVLQYANSNRLIRRSDWDIVLQKTGYISEAGRCLVMQAVIDARPVVMVFLDAKGKYSRAADATLVRSWLEKIRLPILTQSLQDSPG